MKLPILLTTMPSNSVCIKSNISKPCKFIMFDGTFPLIQVSLRFKYISLEQFATSQGKFLPKLLPPTFKDVRLANFATPKPHTIPTTINKSMWHIGSCNLIEGVKTGIWFRVSSVGWHIAHPNESCDASKESSWCSKSWPFLLVFVKTQVFECGWPSLKGERIPETQLFKNQHYHPILTPPNFPIRNTN